MSNSPAVTPRDVAAAMCEMQNGLQFLFHMLNTKPAIQEMNERSRVLHSRAVQIRDGIAMHKQHLSACRQILTLFPAAND